MNNVIYINKKGIIKLMPVWISINNNKYKLYTSNRIQFATTQKKNILKIREIFFIHYKEIEIETVDTSVTLDLRVTKFDYWMRNGLILVSLFCMFYVSTNWTFIPTQMLFYILFGYMGVCMILILLFKRKNYFEVQRKDDIENQ
jgi:hypothetical protein